MFNKLIISKNNLINNIKQVKHKNPNSKVCAMVKANAYGVGDIQVVNVLNDYVDFWGVACFFEAKRIEDLTSKPILILGAVEKGCVEARFRYACSSLEELKFLISLNKPIKIHLKVNSGMNRYGFKDLEIFNEGLKLIKSSKLIFEGLFTHFATIDEFVQVQMERFNRFVVGAHKMGFYPIVHSDNSFVNEKFNHGLDMVRIGFSLYNRNDCGFKAVAKIKSEIVLVQEVSRGELIGYDYRCVAQNGMKVGIVPLGYADGFDLRLIGMEIDHNDCKLKILNISMDCLMLDIGGTKLKKGDQIYFLNKLNSLNKYAQYLSTSPYEVMTKFNSIRAERIIY